MRKEKKDPSSSLLAPVVPRHGLGSLEDGVFRQLSGKKKANCSLDLERSDGRFAIVTSQTSGLPRKSVEHVIHETIHNGHGLGRYTKVRVSLLQHFVKGGAV